ncbi:MAG: hypothetical protein GW827_11765 [Flavobacteriales bacterium]|nr:hypothetical protein [Flavobacteriales bacterium]PIV95045.1 MAG: hypothetical protein COW44_01120 [Flavobacteriaceae bacterium CG17_big_fil_post_rev_8_21_14_2_50_33_15]PIY11502.1 MAG: hypothetical protein COZ17_06525 [Flavobacteriaceae bacterium CG_4_10_14_3_um_filter_33_47]PJB17683.1 MAG: hypothetical protein CO117_10620 [Flavobacteriaceae bacterium CG_4_9_14_3_um_filter_33_16]NCP90893.1 hypothetical protein [Flavobacteriales bacterium]
MNKTLKSILLVVGLVLLIYGVYTVFAPEASLSIGSLDITAQDNTNSYIMIGLGLASILISFIGGKYLN